MIVYLADLSEIEANSNLILKYEGLLSDTEKERYLKMADSHRKLQFLVGRSLIFENCRQSPVLLENGKPVVKGKFISLAHSGPFVVLALSDSPVGVDIEDSSKIKNFDALAGRLGFSLTSDKHFSFYQNFTRYEADYKMAENNLKIAHKFYSIKTFIVCVSLLNNKENIDFVKSTPFVSVTPFIPQEIADENIS